MNKIRQALRGGLRRWRRKVNLLWASSLFREEGHFPLLKAA